MPGQLRPRGVTMRDCLKNRAGYDRVLMAVAATFLTVSATSAFAQADPARNSAAELAIDAATPRPEPANAPPPPSPPPAPPAPPPPADPANEPVKAASSVPAADQPVADKLKDLLGSKS